MEKEVDWFEGLVSVIALPGMRATYKDEAIGKCFGFPLVMLFYRDRDPLILEIDNHGFFNEPKDCPTFMEFDGAGVS